MTLFTPSNSGLTTSILYMEPQPPDNTYVRITWGGGVARLAQGRRGCTGHVLDFHVSRGQLGQELVELGATGGYGLGT